MQGWLSHYAQIAELAGNATVPLKSLKSLACRNCNGKDSDVAYMLFLYMTFRTALEPISKKFQTRSVCLPFPRGVFLVTFGARVHARGSKYPRLKQLAARLAAQKDLRMLDILFIAIGIGAFFVTALYLPACASL
jgi:hypothetical protein